MFGQMSVFVRAGAGGHATIRGMGRKRWRCVRENASVTSNAPEREGLSADRVLRGSSLSGFLIAQEMN
jgi:hypothetical protein